MSGGACGPPARCQLVRCGAPRPWAAIALPPPALACPLPRPQGAVRGHRVWRRRHRAVPRWVGGRVRAVPRWAGACAGGSWLAGRCAAGPCAPLGEAARPLADSSPHPACPSLPSDLPRFNQQSPRPAWMWWWHGACTAEPTAARQPWLLRQRGRAARSGAARGPAPPVCVRAVARRASSAACIVHRINNTN